jgi:hypothetical protein
MKTGKFVRRRILLLAALIAFALPATLQAQFNIQNNGNGTCIITSYTGSGGTVTIPDIISGLTVVSIGGGAFEYCTSLTNVIIGTGVTFIGSSAFSHCTKLASINIPASVITIGGTPFDYCTSLTAITVDAQNSVFSSADGVLYDKNQITLVSYPGGKVGSYTIPGQ